MQVLFKMKMSEKSIQANMEEGKKKKKKKSVGFSNVCNAGKL